MMTSLQPRSAKRKPTPTFNAFTSTYWKKSIIFQQVGNKYLLPSTTTAFNPTKPTKPTTQPKPQPWK